MSKANPLQVCPGRCLGFLGWDSYLQLKEIMLTYPALGAALQDIVPKLKSQPQTYPVLDIFYSPADPLSTPITISLPKNGLRLRFDGATQRLRLIEVLDFSLVALLYENRDIVKLPQDGSKATGPAFRHIYDRLIGPTFPGEYLPPADGSTSKRGLYILSYPGVAFTFPVRSAAWSDPRDFVSLLSQHAEPASNMAIFDGESWRAARADLYDRTCPIPRPFLSGTKVKETRPNEVDFVLIKGSGVLEIHRRSSSTFRLCLGSSTPQDLLVELGPPDAIYRKSDRRLSIHKAHRKSRSSSSNTRFEDGGDTGYSSHAVTTDESDAEDEVNSANEKSNARAECFWNYFQHGIDIFMSCPQPVPDRMDLGKADLAVMSAAAEPNHLVATKALLHGNVPGSYPFNRYRRCRWRLAPTSKGERTSKVLTSETSFHRISRALQKSLDAAASSKDNQRHLQQGMILNRGWGTSPESSCELLGGWEESRKPTGAGDAAIGEDTPGTGNSELFGFPGLIFEVLKNDTVSCLTIY